MRHNPNTINYLRKFCDGSELGPFELDELKAASLIHQNPQDGSWFVTATGAAAVHEPELPLSEDSSQCPDDDSYLPPKRWNPKKAPAILEADPLNKQDMVNHPPHYKQGDIECIDAIKAALTEEEYRGYCKGNALKYIWRERHKGGSESLAKAGWYLDRMAK